LQLEQIAKTFVGGVEAVAPLDLSISTGEFVAMIGPSGCGKSTLLRMIAGLEKPTSGSIRRIGQAGADVAYVFQDAHLLPWRRVLANVALPLELAGVEKQERLERAHRLLEEVGLSGLERRFPAQLSGGQRMRVSLARAMVTSPRLLLLDEPFAALDEITRQQLDEWLRQLWIDSKATVLFVTHSIAEATFLADRAIVFSTRPAKIVTDHDLSAHLPHQRSADLRGTPGFAQQTRVLYQALRTGDGT
jgi:NitT/TauT family transport system ATP-binding protein